MNIAIDISQSIYKGTGVATYTRNLVKSLLEIDTENVYTLFGSTLRRQEELLEFIGSLPKAKAFTAKLSLLPPTILDFLWNQLHIFSIDRFVGKQDLVHTSDWTEPQSRVPKITTIHDLIVYKYPGSLPNSIIEIQKRKLAWVEKECQAVIADSESTKKDIVSFLQIPEKRIHVVYLGVDAIFYPQKIDSVLNLKRRFGIKKNYLLCVGTREPRKNLQRVIDAFKELNLPDYQLVIVGNPGWGTKIKSTSNCVIAGNVSNQDLAVFYSGATCFVYPSLYEGFGLPVLEAMSCGTPVVTSNRGSSAEITGERSVVVEPEVVEDIARGIRIVLNWSAMDRKKMISQAIKHAKKFTWKKTAQNTIQVYKSV